MKGGQNDRNVYIKRAHNMEDEYIYPIIKNIYSYDGTNLK